jgi:hypothetical protein
MCLNKPHYVEEGVGYDGIIISLHIFNNFHEMLPFEFSVQIFVSVEEDCLLGYCAV